VQDFNAASPIREAMPPNAATALQIDRSELIVGRYRPIRPLGAGGSGQVWLALDEDSGREVALKIVAKQGRAAQRAEREAEAVWRLQHPGCARDLTLEEDAEHVYLVYEYIPGRTLREGLRSRALSDAQVIEAAAQLLDALEHAHSMGIVHRDVKPTNVILEDGPGIRTRLLDFGLALIDNVDALTAAGDVPGTLAYISPERLDGSDATEAADVWSVGLILWEGLCGRHPFFGNSATETTRRILAGPGSLGDERPELPVALIDLIDRSLALDPAARPSVGELASSLRQLTQTRRRPTRSRPERRARLDRCEATTRGAHAALTGGFVGAMLLLFPFLPQTFTLPLALLVATASFIRPQFGLALALAVPVLPLGDVSSGLAMAYAGFALTWLLWHWRAPLAGSAFALGPPLAAVGLLGLLPLAGIGTRGPLRRIAMVVAGVAAATAFAALRDTSLPFVDTDAPAGLGIAGSENAAAVIRALTSYAWSQPALLTITGVFAVVALLAPLGRRASLWQISVASSLAVAITLLVPTLAFDSVIRTGEIVIAVSLGAGFLARPALARIRETAAARSPGSKRRSLGTPRLAVLQRWPRRAQGSQESWPASVQQSPIETSPVVTDPSSLEEAWSHVIDGAAEHSRASSSHQGDSLVPSDAHTPDVFSAV
jgi:hypothetical protein